MITTSVINRTRRSFATFESFWSGWTSQILRFRFKRLFFRTTIPILLVVNMRKNPQQSRSTAAEGILPWLTVQRKLLAVWLVMGVLPLILQLRSYTQFVRPHHVPKLLVMPHNQDKETTNLTALCPVESFLLAGVWWSIEPAYYYVTDDGIICHTLVPQYNTHGNYFVGNSKVTPHRTAPSSCDSDSFAFQVYLYHGSIGFYSFYEEEVGTYCTKDKAAYIALDVLGVYDMNGPWLVDDTGSVNSRMSYWYSIVGALWLAYRFLVIRRSCALLKSYGRRCDDMGETLPQDAAIVFVQESLRLSAHGATSFHRAALLYLIVEGIMTDLFLIIVTDGWAARIQYASLGYNLSGVVLLLFEMVENTRWLNEKWRMRVKRLMFNYETSLIGELVAALGFQHLLSDLNRSHLKRSKPEALAVSFYFWSLVCHGIVVLVVIAIISSVRVACAMAYVWFKHRSFEVLSERCCVDTALGVRSRIMLLGGYDWENSILYYKAEALKAFGIMKMEEDGVEYLVQHKLHWFTGSGYNLVRIGVIRDQRVEPCMERHCTGVVSFLNRKLGGVSAHTGYYYRTQRTMKTLVSPDESDVP
ncbi:hypothetical protein ON010_g8079 [Phytophthora cinnamomi]|nr:hypothetical protein ON010_g8079 [Phytophthora cinnamomi]